jgi:hypothetical protein
MLNIWVLHICTYIFVSALDIPMGEKRKARGKETTRKTKT